ncbi:hypothetical protein COLO4_19121 [Corchorus olitorius]|uniref:Uncharacterized protein n=1 Tax=Corchorus olitorius TaxID=93759 RepID=A0A1R3J6S4_9ROSI|nr:hypothetical protein COLO4_19121 [Corchorus olitorius]
MAFDFDRPARIPMLNNNGGKKLMGARDVDTVETRLFALGE